MLILALPALAQQSEFRFAAYSQLLSPEKLYLHTDREVYRVGDTIWFKCYLENASREAEFPASNFIYVELLSSLVEKNVQIGETRPSQWPDYFDRIWHLPYESRLRPWYIHK